MKIYFVYENEKITILPATADSNGNLSTVDNSELRWGYDAEFYTYQNGKVTPKSEVDVKAIQAAREAQIQQAQQDAVGFDVVLQHMVNEKKAELQWDASKQYHIDDVVYHNGEMWKATSNNTNNEPDDVIGDWEKV